MSGSPCPASVLLLFVACSYVKREILVHFLLADFSVSIRSACEWYEGKPGLTA
jgi:hypothetical protein